MIPIATVDKISGKVYVVGLTGEIREVNAGETIYEDEVIVTHADGDIDILLFDGSIKHFGANQEASISADMLDLRFSQQMEIEQQALVEDDISDILEALESGEDIDSIIEAPAAGGATGDQGHSFVRLARILESLPDLGLENTAQDSAFLPDLDAEFTDENLVVPPINVSLQADASVAEGDSITYIATIDTPTNSDVTITLTNGETLVIPAGETSASISVVTIDTPTTGETSVSNAIANASSESVSNVVIDSTPVTTTVTDTVTPTHVTLSAADSVVEGESLTITATLENVPASPVTIELSDGSIITIPAGQLSSSVQIPVEDDIYQSTNPISISVIGAEGGDFEELNFNDALIETAIVDVANTTTLQLSASPTVTEGDEIVYTATLDQPAGSTMTITLSNGLLVSILEGELSGSVPAIAADDAVVGGGSVSVSISNVLGGEFESLVVDDTPATTNIIDDTDTTLLRLEATPSVVEGETITYTAILDAPSGSEVTILLSNNETITIPAGESVGTVEVSTQNDAYVNSEISANIISVSGGNFENLEVDASPVTTEITDSTDTTTLTLEATQSVAEGGSITYIATLDTPAATPVSILLSNDETITIAAGETSGTVEIAVGNDVYTGGESVSANIVSASGGNFENLEVDTTPVTTEITDVADATALSLEATPSVAEGGTITYTATLGAPAETAVSVLLSNDQTITIAAGETTGTLEVTAANDVYVGADSVSMNIVSASGGNFESLSVDTTPVTTEITDVVDTTALTLQATPSVAENGTITYTATLGAPAETAVSVLLSNDETITIAAGETAGTLEVTASNDVYVGADAVSMNIVSTSGGNFENLSVDTSPVTTEITDVADTTTLILEATPSVAEGGSITYTATLDAPAETAVSVLLSNDQTITIAAGETTGTLEVNAGNDVYVGADSVSMNIVSAGGGNFENLSVDTTPVTTEITDVVDTTTLSLQATPSVAENGTITYTATLGAPAETAVSVLLSNDQTITIAAGETTGTLEVTAGNDVYVGADSVSMNIVSASGGNFENLSVDTSPVTTEITDVVDTTALTLQATPSVAENGTITYTATLGAPADTAVSVLLSNDQTITIAAGETTGTLEVTASNDVYVGADAVSMNIVSASGGNFENLSVDTSPVTTEITDVADTTTLSLQATPSVAENGTITYTATLGAPAETVVSVLLSNDQTITIAAGETTGTLEVTAVNDVYVGADSVSMNIVSASGGNFENLSVDTSPVTTEITDVVDTTTLSLQATPSVAENGTITYTATLGAPAETAVSVLLSNDQTITIAAGETTGTLEVTAANDVYVGADSVSMNIVSASGGNFESLSIDTSPVTTEITDVVDATTLSLQATSSVAENGTITYTATLGAPAETAVSVLLSNDQTITIAAGETTGTLEVTAANDVYVGGDSVSMNIVSASGGNFENLSVDTTPVTTEITDVVDTTSLSLQATPSVAENGTITYTATLGAPAETAVSVLLSNDQTITIAAGETTGTLEVTAANDVYVGADSVSMNIVSANGGNFENLLVDTTPVTTEITDVEDTTILTLDASPSVAEGGTITYTATLGAPAETAVSVLLSNDQTIAIAAGETTGTLEVTAGNDVYVGADSVSMNIVSASGGNFENLSVDTSPVTTEITDVADTTTLSLEATLSVAEGGTITYTATLGEPAATAVSVLLSNDQTITIATGETSGTLEITAGNDVYDGADSVSMNIASASGGNFENLSVDTSSVTTEITDVVDTTTLTLEATPSVVEGGTITYTATLGAPAETAVSVLLSNDQTITIAAGETTGTLEITADNDVYVGADSVSMNILSASGGNYENLSVDTSPVTTEITDVADTTILSLEATPSVAEGGTITYTVTLGEPVETAVSVLLSNDQTINIAAGETTGTLEITADNDVYLGADAVSMNIVSASGGNFENLEVDTSPVTTEITDVVDTTALSLQATPSVAENGTITYTATLGAPAETAVSVLLSNDQTITIAAGETTGTIEVTASNDVYDGADSVSMNIVSASGGNFENLSVDTSPVITEITDVADTTTLSLEATPSVAEGGTITYTATLGAPAETAVSVLLSNEQTITIAAGETTGTLEVTANNDVYVGADAVSMNIVSASGGNFENLSVDTTPVTTEITDVADTTTLSLEATPSVAEGGAITYTVTLGEPAETAVSILLSNDQTITIAAGETMGTLEVTASNDVYVGADSVSMNIVSASGGNFENLEVDTTPVTTEITDSVDTTTLSLEATPSVAEGGTITYTATLGAPAESTVSVLLSNDQTITIAAGETTGTLEITADNDVYVGADSVSMNILSASGGNYENLSVDTSPVTTEITDVADTTILSLEATPSVAEGGTITYTATLGAPAETAVSVLLSNDQAITIAAGETTGTLEVTADNDVYVGADSVSMNIVSASGGNFENLSVDTSPVTTEITDVVDSTTLILEATPSVAENGTITYTVTLGEPAETAVSVLLSNDQTITIAAGETTGTLEITADNDVYVGTDAVSMNIVSASGGNFENLSVDTSPVTTEITDVADTTTLTLDATPSVAEGGTITYAVTLGEPAETAVSILLSNDQSITIAAGETMGTLEVTASNDVYVGADSVSMNIVSASGGNFENLEVNTSPVTTEITDVADTTTLSLEATPSVVENGTITYTATIGAPAETAVSVLLSNDQTITIAAGETTGTLEITADNDVYVGADSVSMNIVSAIGGNFENLSVDTSSVTTEITDVVDTTTLTLEATPSVAEGGTITYTVTLGAPAETAVSVFLSNDQTITIAAGETTGTIEVTASNDVYDGADSVSMNIVSASGGNFENLSVDTSPVTTEITDVADTTALSLEATPSVAEGGTITYTATLGAPADTAVSVLLSNDQIITIAAGETTGTIEVTASNDVYVGADAVPMNIVSASGGNFENLSVDTSPVTTEITDVADTTTLTLDATPSVAEGGTITYAVTLGEPAETAVSILLSNDQTITIAAGETMGTLEVTASNDVYVGADSVSMNIVSASGGNFENLEVDTTPVTTEITDSVDTTTLSLEATPSVAEGGTITYTATLGAPAESTVSVLLSNDQTITIDAGEIRGTLEITADNDVYVGADSVSMNIVSASGGNFENLSVDTSPVTTEITDVADTTALSLEATPSVAEGGTITYTATLGAPAETAVSVLLSNDQIITIAAGETTGTLEVTAENDVYVGTDSVSMNIVSASGGNFENLSVDTSPVITEITDVADTTTLTLDATPSVAEGGTITYTVTLGEPAETAVSVLLSNDQTITIAAGETTGTLEITADNDVYVGADAVSMNIVSASGGNFENLSVDTSPVTTEITDSVDTTALTLEATPSVAENGTITYTATLGAPAETAVSVLLSNDQTITIAAGETTGTLEVSAGNDVYVGADAVSMNIVSASGGNFENLSVDTTPVTTEITDVADTTTLSLEATPSVVENGTITYTATLGAPAETAVSVLLSNDQTITIAAGETTGTLEITADNDVYVGADAVSMNIVSASGGNFENLSVDTSPVTTEITDVADTTALGLEATPNVAEGGTITYTATLGAPAETAVSVLLSNDQTITIAAGETTGTLDITADNDVYIGADAVSMNIVSASGGNFENLSVDTSPVTTEITDVADTTALGLEATPSVAEGGTITYTATLGAPAETAVSVLLSNDQTITITAGETTGTLEVTAGNDVYIGADSVSMNIVSANGGNFENLSVDTSPVTTEITDIADTTTLSLEATPSVAEGGTITYTVTLGAPAETAVSVLLSNDQTITIAAGETTGTLEITADNDVYVGADAVSMNIVSASGGNFENLSVDTSSVTTEITDVVDTTTLTLEATPSVVEGGTITYTATLGAPAETAVSVLLSNDQTITIAAGETTGTLEVSAANDVYVGADSVSMNIVSASGGNFENLEVDTTPVTTEITDVTDTTTLSLEATPSVAENGTITYTATLGAPAETAVSILLSNDQTITIAAGETTGTLEVSAGNDVYVGADAVSMNIVSASGGNFENLSVDTTPVTTEITDVADTTTLSLEATPSVVENGTITYTATLGAPAETAVSVLLSNDQTITIAAGETTGTLEVTAANDVYVGADSVSMNIVSASGGNFENLEVDTTPVTTEITDVTDTTTLSLEATPSVAENGTITYTATLGAPAETAVSVLLSNDQTITIAAGDTTGTLDITADNDVYIGADAVSMNIVSASGGNFENLSVDTSPVTTEITDVADTTTLILEATPSVAEGGSITYTATLDAPAETAVSVLLSNDQTITIAAGETTGTLEVNAGNDVYVGADSVSMNIVSAGGGNFENLSVDTTPVTTEITDVVDTTTLSLQATPSVAENGTITYTATLGAPAETAVSVLLSNDQTITIAAGETTGTLEVTAGNDVYVGADSVSMNIVSASGGNFENLSVDTSPVTTEITDVVDTTALTLQATPSVAENGTITYTATLGAPADTAVSVLLSNDQTITIAAGETTGTLEVTASNDVYVGADAVSMNIVSASGGNFENLSVDTSPVTTEITDVADTTTLSLQATPSVAENGTITYTATLGAPAETVVSVLLSNDQTITIAAGETTGTLEVTAVNDVYVGADSVSMNIVSASGGNFENLSVDTSPVTTEITDVVDTTTLSLQATPSVAENGTITYTATLGAPAETAVSVLLSNDQTITIAAGETTGTLEVTAANDVYVGADSVSMNIVSASGGNFESLSIDTSPVTTEITDVVDATSLSLQATPSVAENGTITYTATLGAPAETAVSVLLSNDQTITIAAGETTGTLEVTAANDVYVGADSVSMNIVSASGGNFESLSVDTTPVTTEITDVVDTTALTLQATPSVAENGTITYTATLGAPADTAVSVLLSNDQTITIAAGETTGTLEVTASNDVYVGADAVSMNIVSASGGNFENLSVDTSPVTTEITDSVDTTTLSLQATPSVLENGTITYTATIGAPAESAVSVLLSNDQTITIAAGETTGTLEVTAGNDVYVGADSVSMNIVSASGGNFENLEVDTTPVTTEITDTPDIVNLTLSATPSVNEGEAITYTANLDHPAGSNLSIVLSNGQTILITSGSTTASIVVNAGGGSSASVSINSTSGGNFESLNVDSTPAVTTINDLPPTISVSAVDVTEESVTAGDVIATFTSSDPGGDALTHQLLNNSDGYFEIVGNEVRLTQAGVDAINDDSLSITSLDISVQVMAESLSSSDTSTSTVTRVNEAPLTQAENYATVEGSVLNINAASGVLVNDSDPENSEINVFSFAADTAGSNAQTANGTNSITTILGGTVILRADGSFTYQPPASLIHRSAETLQDSFAYRATDGSINSDWTEVTIDVSDTAPQAIDDFDFVPFGETVIGNVVTGQGNAVGEDSLGQDAIELVSVALNGVTYSSFDGAGNLFVNADYGFLVINRNGTYTYTSTQSVPSTSVGGGDASTWSDVTLYGFNGGTSVTSGGQLDLGNANASIVYASSGLAINSPGGSDNWDQLDSSNSGREAIVIDLESNATSASVRLGAVGGNDGGRWTTYDENGNFVSTDTFPSGTTEVYINTGENFQYVVFAPEDGNDDFTINGLTFLRPVPDLQENFTYTIEDADGDQSSAILNVSHSTSATAEADENVAYEAALDQGTSPNTLSTISSGNIIDNDAAVSSSTEISHVTFNGVEYTANSAGVITVTTSQGQLTVYTENDFGNNIRVGDYNYEILDNNVLGDNSSEVFEYTLNDGLTSSSAQLTINIVDDAPIGGDVETTITAADATQTYNLVVVLDRSGSMGYDVNGNSSSNANFDSSQVRMDIARDALTQLFDAYDSIGNVNIKIVDFASDVSSSGWIVDNLGNAVEYLDNVNPNGGTEYSTAINEVMNDFNAPAADRNLVYFISDGEPSGGYAVNASQQADWEAFVSANDIDISFGIGIGNVSVAALEPIAYPNQDSNNDGIDDYAIQVSDANDLATTLLATLDQGVVSGSISILEGDGSAGFFVGADGGFIQQIIVDGVTYEYDPGVQDSVNVTTDHGGTLFVNFVTGEYFYRVSLEEEITGEQEIFTITASDNDGDTLTANLVVNLEYSPTIDANRDLIITNTAEGSAVLIADKVLLFNDVPNYASQISSVENIQGESVTQTGGVINYTPGSIEDFPAASDFSSTAQAIDESNSDSESNPENNSIASATIISRSSFGSDGSALPGLDFGGYSVGYFGAIEEDGNSANGTDEDWLNVSLAQGEVMSIDIDNASIPLEIQVYDEDGNYLGTVANNGQPWGSFSAESTGEYYFQIAPLQAGSTSYELYMSINNNNATYPEPVPLEFSYSISIAGASDTTAAEVQLVSGSELLGTDDDDILVGGATNDTLVGGEGDDALQGNAGSDILQGGDGDDLLLGGIGDDILSGGLGADVFAWELADKGTEGAPELDTITDFDANSASNGGDVLDLRDLLIDESESSLSEFLFVEVQDGNTIVHVSSTGGFDDGVYNSSVEDQTIELSGVDLVTPFGGDQDAIIQDLINRGKLLSD